MARWPGNISADLFTKDKLRQIILHIFKACEPAARLALEDVNNRSDLLPGFILKLHWNDSEVIHKF